MGSKNKKRLADAMGSPTPEEVTRVVTDMQTTTASLEWDINQFELLCPTLTAPKRMIQSSAFYINGEPWVVRLYPDGEVPETKVCEYPVAVRIVL